MSENTSPSTAPPEPVEINVKLPVKEKKPRSEAQKAAQQKALAVLKARREAKANEDHQVKESKAIAKEKWKEAKRVHPGEEIVTKKDLDALMVNVKDLLSKNVVEKVVEKPVMIEKIVEKPVEKVIERIVERSVPVQPKKLSGHELLDTLFGLK